MSDIVQFGTKKPVMWSPKEFRWELKTFDLDDRENANGHHEGRVKCACGPEMAYVDDDLFTDTFVVTGREVKAGERYRLEFSIDSESKIDLWGGGKVILDYNLKTKSWKMTGEVDGREWKFCSADAVLQTILYGLSCFATESDGYAIDSKVLHDAIEGDAAQILSSAAKYTNASGMPIDDCSYNPPAPSERISPWEPLPIPD